MVGVAQDRSDCLVEEMEQSSTIGDRVVGLVVRLLEQQVEMSARQTLRIN